MIEISVIIPTYERINSLCDTLESVLACKNVPVEIIIVDQSKDMEVSKKAINRVTEEYEGHLHYEHMETPSSTAARNRGIELANCDILVFMDDDIHVEENTFGNVFSLMQDEKYAMIGGLNKRAAANGRLFPFLFDFRSWKNRKIGHVTDAMFGRYPDPNVVTQEINTQWAMGFFFAVKKSLLDEWEICFDETLGKYAYAEDLDFSYSYYKKAMEAGLKCILTPQVKVDHMCSQEWRESNRRASYVIVFNRYYLMHKHKIGGKHKMVFYWSNLGLLIKKIKEKDNLRDFMQAMRDCYQYRKDIAKGIMHTELYEVKN